MSSTTRTNSGRREKDRSTRQKAERRDSGYADERVRAPRIDMRYGTNARDQIAYTVAEEILKDPSVDTGKLIETIDSSNSILNVSDATLLVSSAILANIGASRQSASVLKRSATVARMYARFRLDDPSVLKDFTTLIFTLSSGIRKTVEAAVISSMKIRSEQTDAADDAPVVISAFTRLANQGLISKTDAASTVVSAIKSNSGSSMMSRIKSAVSTASASVAPSDSVSRVGASPNSSPESAHSLAEGDLMSYVSRRKTGVEPKFEHVFKHAAPPIAVTIPSQRTRHGLGYTSRPSPGYDFNAMITDLDTAISGMGMSNTRTAAEDNSSETRPIINTTPVSASVFNEVPDDASDAEWTMDMRNAPKPLPSTIMTDESESTVMPTMNRVPARVHSPTLEEILASMI